jgi:putative acetyltransferase
MYPGCRAVPGNPRAPSVETVHALSVHADAELVIRREESGDVDAIADVVARAFGSPKEAALVAALRASSNFVPEWSLVAMLDDRIVGHVMVTFATLRDGSDEHRVASLSPLSVDPEDQGRGIGSALVRAITPLVDAAQEPVIVLEGSPSYYSRFGFEHSVPLGITITVPEWAPTEAAQVLRLSGYDPSIRGRLVYPAAFQVMEQ